MAETSVTSTNTKLQAAADGAVLQLAARGLIILICAVALPMGAWMGSRLIGTLDRLVESVAGLTTDMAVVKTDIGYLKEKVKP